MIKYVIKAGGYSEPFSAGKLNRWGAYASRHGVEFSTIVLETVRSLPETVQSNEITQKMIDICIAKEDINYSRMAARLELAKIRKAQERNGFQDRYLFQDIFKQLIELGVWDKASLPDFDPKWNDWYRDVYANHLEYWQIKQFADKYGLKYKGEVVETPHIAAMGIALAHFGNTERAFQMAKAIIRGQINLPTPALNGGRNGDFDSVSCCITSSGDSIESIGVTEHIAYRMTSKKAGIGCEFRTRSKGAPVKDGRVDHLGKHPIYSTVDKAVKMFQQVTRGGSATVTFTVLDPEIMAMLLWKSQRVDMEQRLDKLDFSLAYNDAFIDAVIKDEDWYLFDLRAHPKIHEAFYSLDSEDYRDFANATAEYHDYIPSVKARDLLKAFLTVRQETGRVYSLNVTRVNKHTPFEDTVYLSNLCQEVMLPTKPYVDMPDLYQEGPSEGETAFCSIAAINVAKVELDEYDHIAELALRFVDSMIEKAPAMTGSMGESMKRRRSVGIGITGLAQYLYLHGLDYDGSQESIDFVGSIAEVHYYHLLRASQAMVQDGTCKPVEGITDWLPIDTMVGDLRHSQGLWEQLRGQPRGHSVLVAHMPTESSAVFSGATNGLYPPRQRITYKQSRKGAVQFIIDQPNFLAAWDIPNETLSRYYGAVQNFTDQGISCDYYVSPEDYPNGKVPMSVLMKEFIAHAKLGNKSQYYVNTRPNKPMQVKDFLEQKEIEEEACTSCTL